MEKDSKKMAKEEIKVFQKAGRPDLVKHEKAEYGLKGGGTVAKKPNPFAKFEKSGADKEVKGKGKEGSKAEEKFDKGQFKFAKGGFVRSADGIASKGKTKAKQISMKKGGKC